MFWNQFDAGGKHASLCESLLFKRYMCIIWFYQFYQLLQLDAISIVTNNHVYIICHKVTTLVQFDTLSSMPVRRDKFIVTKFSILHAGGGCYSDFILVEWAGCICSSSSHDRLGHPLQLGRLTLYTYSITILWNMKNFWKSMQAMTINCEFSLPRLIALVVCAVCLVPVWSGAEVTKWVQWPPGGDIFTLKLLAQKHNIFVTMLLLLIWLTETNE